MSEQKKESAESTDNVGSSNADDLISNGSSANNDAGGRSEADKEIDLENYVPKDQYEEAAKKIGEQGTELGDYRKFFKEISPLLDKLQDHPEITEAIMEGKIDSEMAQAVLEGKIQLQDATVVAEAHNKVKKDLGANEYKKTDEKDLEKLVIEKMEEIKKELKETVTNVDRKLSDSEEKRKFEGGINEFIGNTPDFSDYADEINTWFEEHPEQYDIRIAYDAVKGRKFTTEGSKAQAIKAAEAAKDLASNVSGGGSQGAQIGKDDSETIDSIIGNVSNPNVF